MKNEIDKTIAWLKTKPDNRLRLVSASNQYGGFVCCNDPAATSFCTLGYLANKCKVPIVDALFKANQHDGSIILSKLIKSNDRHGSEEELITLLEELKLVL